MRRFYVISRSGWLLNGSRNFRTRSLWRSSLRFRTRATSRSCSETMPAELSGLALHNRKPRKSRLRHAKHNHAQRFIGMRHHGFADHVAERSARRAGLRELVQFLARNHTFDPSFAIHHREKLLPPLGRLPHERMTKIFHCCAGRKHYQLCAHHFTRKQDLQRIGRILARDMEASPRHFLGQDRSLQQQHRGCVREHSRRPAAAAAR